MSGPKRPLPPLLRGTAGQVLGVLDRCAKAFTFPVLDNGYVYLAGARLSVHRALTDAGVGRRQPVATVCDNERWYWR